MIGAPVPRMGVASFPRSPAMKVELTERVAWADSGAPSCKATPAASIGRMEHPKRLTKMLADIVILSRRIVFILD